MQGQVLEGQNEVINQGGALQKTGTEFTQAITIQKPRDRMEVIKNCELEAAIAGEEFYYAWTVKSKSGRRKLVEGMSIGGALAAARNWGNCAIPCEVKEHSDHYVFTATFVDFETGFNMQRVFRQRKEQNVGMQDTARAEDIIFQIGQSKAIRNVCLNALPNWLTKKMLDKAKKNMIADILKDKDGLERAKQKILDVIEQHDITQKRVEDKMAKSLKAWTAEDVVLIRGALSALVNGQESAESLFPVAGEDAADKTNKKVEGLKDKLKGSKAKKDETKAKKDETKDPTGETEFPPKTWEEQMNEHAAEMGAEAFNRELSAFNAKTLSEVKEKDREAVLTYFNDSFGGPS
jgi:hypothetical protein